MIQSSNSSPLSVKVDKESHKAVVGFGDVVLSPGIAELALEYKGTLNDNMMGFYRKCMSEIRTCLKVCNSSCSYPMQQTFV